jgi:putative heme-binding domain-containing protein
MYKLIHVSLVLLFIGFNPCESIVLAQASKKLKSNMIDQGEFNPALKGIAVLEGFKVEVVAQNPNIVNPSSISFSDDGKVFVLERSTNFTKKLKASSWPIGGLKEGVALKKTIPDKIKALSINKTTGLWESPITLLEPFSPSTFVTKDSFIYLADSGSILRYKIKPDGGLEMKSEIIIKGIAGFNEYQVNALTFGPDGWLYFHFPPGDSLLEGTDGKKIVVLRTGGIARCKPDGKNLELYSTGVRQAQGNLSFDLQGNLFSVDDQISSGAKPAGARLLHLTEGFDFGWHLAHQSNCCDPDLFRILMEGDEAPYSVINLPKVHATSSHAYTDNKLPQKFKNLFLVADGLSHEILGVFPAKDKSTFLSSEYFPFLRSTDPKFFPSQITQGPDGALYIVDQGCSNEAEGLGVGGRILRIRWQGTATDPEIPLRSSTAFSSFDEKAVGDLIALLDSEENFIKVASKNALIRKGKDAVESLVKLLKDEDKASESKLRALEALAHFWDKEVQSICENILADGDPNLQLLAAQYLCRFASPGSDSIFNVLLKHLGSDTPELRNAITLAMGKNNAPGSAESLVNSILFYEGSDIRMLDVFARALELTGKNGTERILAVGDTGVKKDIRKILEVQTMMRTTPALEGTLAWLENQNISDSEIVDLLKSLKHQKQIPDAILSQLALYCFKQPTMEAPIKIALLESLSCFPNASFKEWEKFLDTCLEDENIKTKTACINMIKNANISSYSKKLNSRISSQEIQDEEKIPLLETLAVLKTKESIPIIINILSGTRSQRESLKVRQAALQALFIIDPDKASESIQGLLGSVLFPDTLKSEALQLLEKNPSGAKVLFAYFNSGKCDPNLLPAISECLKKFGLKSSEGKDLNSLLLKKALLADNDLSQLQLFEASMKSSASLERGKETFLNANNQSCVICHAINKNDTTIGPDLTFIQKMETAKIIRSLLDPAHEINPAHSTFELKTKTGKTFIGVKTRSAQNQIMLATATGTISTFSKNEIASLIPVKGSIMPDNLSSELSYRELLDLVFFLKAPTNSKTFSGASYAGQIKVNKGLDDSKSVLISARNDGFFDLQKYSQVTSEQLSFHFYLNSNNQSKSVVTITSRDSFELRINTVLKTEQQIKKSITTCTFDLDLNPGSNLIEIDFSKSKKPEGFYLHFTGDEINGSSINNNPAPKD